MVWSSFKGTALPRWEVPTSTGVFLGVRDHAGIIVTARLRSSSQAFTPLHPKQAHGDTGGIFTPQLIQSQPRKVLDPGTMRQRYVANMRAYTDELIANKRCLLGIREGNVKWTKVEEEQDDEVMATAIKKETTRFDKWWIRQLLRGVETICVVTEFGPRTNNFGDPVKTLSLMTLYEDLMTDHEEEILQHLTTLDYGNADVAKAYNLLPINQAIHTLDEENIEKPVYVPAMFADLFVAMSTQTTADDKLGAIEGCDGLGPEADAAHLQEDAGVLQDQ